MDYLMQCKTIICFRACMILSGNFPSHLSMRLWLWFSLPYWEANSYYPSWTIMGKGNSSNHKIGWDRGLSVPGAFKLDHLHPFQPLFFWNFPTFSLSYWESNSYYPRRTIMGKGNSSNHKIAWDRGLSVPGAFKLDHLHPFKPLLIFWKLKMFHFYTGSPILITPEGQ